MSPVSKPAAILTLLLAATLAWAQEPLPPPAATDQDRVADYLERMNLQPLLLEHLSTAMQQADPDTRLKIAERLARHYAALLAEAGSPQRRQDVVSRAEDLLKLVPQARAYELRVGILKTRYQGSEEQAERFRLRLAGSESRAEAARSLTEIKALLTTLTTDLIRREESLTKAIDSGPADTERFERDLADTRRWRSTSQYFAGWSALYAALIDPASASLAADAEKDFAAILNAGDAPTPDKLDKANLKYEHVARAAIGLAATKALRGLNSDADAWLNLVENTPTSDPSARAAVLRWRITTLAHAGRWADLQREVNKVRNQKDQPTLPNLPAQPNPFPGTLDPIAARHLAVLALESTAQPTIEITRSLARTAIADLITRKQLASVLDLVRSHGQDALTPDATTGSGFIARYVAGMLNYEAATAAVKAASLPLEEPVTSPELINQFNQTAAQLADAAAQSDAQAFKSETVAALTTSARALFMAGRLRDAAERFSAAFEKARDAGGQQTAQDALYLAIATLEKALTRTPPPGKADELAIFERADQLSTLFIKTYPASERAVSLTLRSITRTDRTDEEAVRVLQSVNKDSPAYEAARRQLVRLLYRRFRAAAPADRPFASSRFVKAADEVLTAEKKAALEARGPDITPAVERAVTTGRQMLDALLNTTPPDALKASEVMGTIRQVIITTGASFAPWADELDYRTVQISLGRGNTPDADKSADTLRARMDAAKPATDAFTSARRFHTAARRAILQHADNALRAAATDADKPAHARRVLDSGIPITDELLANPQSLQDAQNAAIFSRVAEAGAILWRQSADTPARDASLRLDKALLAARPNATEPLARYAELVETTGDTKSAADAWRTLASSLPQESPLWPRAKYELFRILADTDRPTAITALQQHLILHPTVAQPWQDRLTTLAAKLGVTAPASPGGSSP